MSIDDRVSVSQIQKAVKSLSTYAASKKKETQESGKVLFDDEDENVWLVVTTKTMSPSLTLKPQRIPLAHPIIDPRVSSICLITKDPQRAYKDLLQKHSIKFISRVVGINKLKGKFSPYDARRQLAGEHGLFLADERVVPLLPTLLGNAFFKKKKQPIPVNLLKKDLKSELEAAISSTYMHQNAGTCLSIKIGHTGMDTRKLLANVEKSIPAATRKLYAVNKRRKNGEKQKTQVKESMKTEEEKLKEREEAWDNIQSLGIKTHSSVCLPIWSCALNERWVVAAPTATASSFKENGIQNGSPSQSKAITPIVKGGEDDDDTMSEGEGSANEEEKRLSKKLAKSSLNGPVKSVKRLGDDLMVESRKQKKRKADQSVEDQDTLVKVTTKKSKKGLADSASSTSPPAAKKSKEYITAVPSTTPSTSASRPEKAVEKSKKVERAKATDFMEEDTLPAKERQKSKKKEHGVFTSARFAAADANLQAHRKDKKRDKVAVAPEAITLPTAKSAVSNPFAAADASLKAHKKGKKALAESSAVTGATDGTALSSVRPSSKPASKPLEAPSSSNPLKSALKKPSPPGSSLTPSELSEKKAKKATFSVIEKKKEKMGKGVIGSASGGKSGKGGKSKASLVGRGPKM